MKKGLKIFMIVGLFTLVGNVIFSVIHKNIFAFGGWLVALLWFPYEEVFIQDNKGEQK